MSDNIVSIYDYNTRAVSKGNTVDDLLDVTDKSTILMGADTNAGGIETSNDNFKLKYNDNELIITDSYISSKSDIYSKNLVVEDINYSSIDYDKLFSNEAHITTLSTQEIDSNNILSNTVTSRTINCNNLIVDNLYSSNILTNSIESNTILSSFVNFDSSNIYLHNVLFDNTQNTSSTARVPISNNIGKIYQLNNGENYVNVDIGSNSGLLMNNNVYIKTNTMATRFVLSTISKGLQNIIVEDINGAININFNNITSNSFVSTSANNSELISTNINTTSLMLHSSKAIDTQTHNLISTNINTTDLNSLSIASSNRLNAANIISDNLTLSNNLKSNSINTSSINSDNILSNNITIANNINTTTFTCTNLTLSNILLNDLILSNITNHNIVHTNKIITESLSNSNNSIMNVENIISDTNANVVSNIDATFIESNNVSNSNMLYANGIRTDNIELNSIQSSNIVCSELSILDNSTLNTVIVSDIDIQNITVLSDISQLSTMLPYYNKSNNIDEYSNLFTNNSVLLYDINVNGDITDNKLEAFTLNTVIINNDTLYSNNINSNSVVLDNINTNSINVPEILANNISLNGSITINTTIINSDIVRINNNNLILNSNENTTTGILMHSGFITLNNEKTDYEIKLPNSTIVNKFLYINDEYIENVTTKNIFVNNETTILTMLVNNVNTENISSVTDINVTDTISTLSIICNDYTTDSILIDNITLGSGGIVANSFTITNNGYTNNSFMRKNDFDNYANQQLYPKYLESNDFDGELTFTKDVVISKNLTVTANIHSEKLISNNVSTDGLTSNTIVIDNMFKVNNLNLSNITSQNIFHPDTLNLYSQFIGIENVNVSNLNCLQINSDDILITNLETNHLNSNDITSHNYTVDTLTSYNIITDNITSQSAEFKSLTSTSVVTSTDIEITNMSCINVDTNNNNVNLSLNTVSDNIITTNISTNNINITNNMTANDILSSSIDITTCLSNASVYSTVLQGIIHTNNITTNTLNVNNDNLVLNCDVLVTQFNTINMIHTDSLTVNSSMIINNFNNTANYVDTDVFNANYNFKTTNLTVNSVLNLNNELNVDVLNTDSLDLDNINATTLTSYGCSGQTCVVNNISTISIFVENFTMQNNITFVGELLMNNVNNFSSVTEADNDTQLSYGAVYRINNDLYIKNYKVAPNITVNNNAQTTFTVTNSTVYNILTDVSITEGPNNDPVTQLVDPSFINVSRSHQGSTIETQTTDPTFDTDTMDLGVYTITLNIYDKFYNLSQIVITLTIPSPITYISYIIDWSNWDINYKRQSVPSNETRGFVGDTYEVPTKHGTSNIWLQVNQDGGSGEALDNLTLLNTISFIQHTADVGNDYYNPSYNLYEVKNVISPSYSVTNTLNMSNIGSIVKFCGLYSTTTKSDSSSAYFQYYMNVYDKKNTGTDDPTKYMFGIHVKDRYNDMQLIIKNYQSVTLLKIYGVPYTGTINHNAINITTNGGRIYRKGGVIIHSYHKINAALTEIDFKLDVYAKVENTAGIVNWIHIEGTKVIQNTIYTDSGLTFNNEIYREPFQISFDRPTGKVYDGYCFTNKYIDNIENILAEFPSAGIFDNNHERDNIMRINVMDTFYKDSTPGFKAHDDYYTFINKTNYKNEYSQIFKLKGDIGSNNYYITSAWDIVGGKYWIRVFNNVIDLLFHPNTTTNLASNIVTENLIPGTTSTFNTDLNRYDQTGYNFLLNGMFIYMYYKRTSSTTSEYKIEIHVNYNSSLQKIMEITSGTMSYSSSRDTVEHPIAYFKNTNSINEYGGPVICPHEAVFDDYKYYFSTIDSFA